MFYPGTACNESSGPKWGIIEPYGLVFKGATRRHSRIGVWYLIAYCQDCQDFHTFRVSHIENLHVCDKSNPLRPDFDLQAYWREARKHLAELTQACPLKLH